jgi:DNA-binding Xre family transcriptional regulator
MIRLKIKEVAEAQGINKARLSRITGLGTTTVHELWENIRAENVRIGTLSRIGRKLGVPASALYEEIVVPGEYDEIEDLELEPAMESAL